MKLLAIETATEVCGVALTEHNQLAAELRVRQKNAHNEKLVAAIDYLMRQINWRLEELDGIALSIGPGSFTGLRIGISVAKGLAFTLEKPLVAVNTLDAMAHGARFWGGRLAAVIKARTEEGYFALYESKRGEVKRISDYQILAITALPDYLKKETLVLAHPRDLFAELASGTGGLALLEHPLLDALTIALMGYVKLQNGETENLAALEPFYLKQFEPKRKVYHYDSQ
jgi:tRNA threonylcarbamoyladenosine biosynthesis protein TsaB